MISRTYKDSLFRFLFGRVEHKDWLLSLYNALNHSNYTNPEEIELSTIDNVIFLGLRNDVSFIIGDHLMMVEHQSTFSRNMSIRFLLYYAKLLEGYLQKNDLDLYHQKALILPSPRFIVFYNGSRITNEYDVEYLTTHFQKNNSIELKAEFFNINKNKNMNLKRSCKVLEEYCWVNDFIETNRDTMTVEDAIEFMYQKLPKEFSIYNLLLKHKAEVKGMILETFDKERFGNTMYEDGVYDGIEQGIASANKEMAKKMKEANEPIQKIMAYTELTKEEIEEL